VVKKQREELRQDSELLVLVGEGEENSGINSSTFQENIQCKFEKFTKKGDGKKGRRA